ncbi:MAG: O-antigen ligase family protein [Dysgonomonas sp.]|uniref:O-antigen ligase family protein n=1 Tax=Dysgonomonas sp. TaxID=1891233 RepID=UPI003A838B26
MVATSFIILYTFFCLKQKDPLNILISIIYLIPYHFFFSFLFTYIDQDPGLFPIWKDLGSIIFLIKVLLGKHHKMNKTTLLLLSLFFILITLFFFQVYGKEDEALPIYRLYINGLSIAMALSLLYLDADSLRKLVRCIVISALIIGVTNIIQYFVIREALHFFMEHYEINRYGELVFQSVSMTIMGYERMSGFVGGPNSLGLVLSFFIILMTSFYAFNRGEVTKVEKSFIFLIILLNIFCFILSFSRAGWAIFFISYILILYFKGKLSLVIKYLFWGGITLILIAFFAFSFIPEVAEIIQGTFSGEEGSAATRGDMVTSSYQELLYNPFGHGLGASRADGAVFAESSFLNTAFDIGLPGVIFLYLIWFYFYLRMKRNGNNIIYIVSRSILIASAIACFVSVNPLEWPYFYYLWGIIGIGINPSFKDSKNEA